MSDILDAVANLGAGILASVLTLALGAGCLWIGMRAGERTGKTWVGWLAGLAAFVVLGLLFYPSIDALKKKSCSGADDFEECMEGSDEPPDYR